MPRFPPYGRLTQWLVWFFALTTGALFLSGGLFFYVVQSFVRTPAIDTDFAGFYAAARALGHDTFANVYQQPVLASALTGDNSCVASLNPLPAIAHVYPYPYFHTPFLATILQPLTLLPCGTAYRVWVVFSLVLWMFCVVLAVALLRRAWHGWSRAHAVSVPLAVVLTVVSPLMLWSLGAGQVTALLLALLLLAFWLLPRRPELAGACLALAALIEVFPALLLVYALCMRDWRTIRGALIAGAIGLALMTWRAPAALIAYPGSLVSGNAWIRGIPWNNALSQVAGVGPLLVGIVLVVWLSVMVVLNTRLHGPPTLEGYAWTLVTALLVTPVLWTIYLVFLLPVVLVILARRRVLEGAIAALAYLAVTVCSPDPVLYAPWLALVTLGLWMLTGWSLFQLALQRMRRVQTQVGLA